MIDLEPLKKRIEMDAPGLWRWFSAADVRALIDEVERLTDDLAVNARLLGRQCDLAREAEAERDELRRQLAEIEAGRENARRLMLAFDETILVGKDGE